jgi:hypothetical protein
MMMTFIFAAIWRGVGGLREEITPTRLWSYVSMIPGYVDETATVTCSKSA